MTLGFYKNDNGTLLYAPNFVYSKDYELLATNKDSYIYPIDGWRWFDTRQEALEFYGIAEDLEERLTDLEQAMDAILGVKR